MPSHLLRCWSVLGATRRVLARSLAHGAVCGHVTGTHHWLLVCLLIVLLLLLLGLLLICHLLLLGELLLDHLLLSHLLLCHLLLIRHSSLLLLPLANRLLDRLAVHPLLHLLLLPFSGFNSTNQA